MLPPSPGWTQSGRHPQSSPVRASSACRQPPLPPHRLQPMVLNDGPTPAAVRLCCRAAAGSNRGTRSSDWHRGGSQPRPTVSVCALDPVASMDALFSFFFFSVLCLFPSPPSSRAARRGAAAAGGPRRTRRPAAVMARELQAGQTSSGEMSPSAPRHTTQQRAGPSLDI